MLFFTLTMIYLGPALTSANPEVEFSTDNYSYCRARNDPHLKAFQGKQIYLNEPNKLYKLFEFDVLEVFMQTGTTKYNNQFVIEQMSAKIDGEIVLRCDCSGNEGRCIAHIRRNFWSEGNGCDCQCPGCKNGMVEGGRIQGGSLQYLPRSANMGRDNIWQRRYKLLDERLILKGKHISLFHHQFYCGQINWVGLQIPKELDGLEGYDHPDFVIGEVHGGCPVGYAPMDETNSLANCELAYHRILANEPNYIGDGDEKNFFFNGAVDVPDFPSGCFLWTRSKFKKARKTVHFNKYGNGREHKNAYKICEKTQGALLPRTSGLCVNPIVAEPEEFHHICSVAAECCNQHYGPGGAHQEFMTQRECRAEAGAMCCGVSDTNCCLFNPQSCPDIPCGDSEECEIATGDLVGHCVPKTAITCTCRNEECDTCTRLNREGTGDRYVCERLRGGSAKQCVNKGCYGDDDYCANESDGFGAGYFCASRTGRCELYKSSFCGTSEEKKCGLHDGDCDRDSHCQKGLVCGNNNFHDKHPNVRGVGGSADVCIRQTKCVPHRKFAELQNAREECSPDDTCDNLPVDIKNALSGAVDENGIEITKFSQLVDGDLTCAKQFGRKYYCGGSFTCRKLFGNSCQDRRDFRCQVGEGDCDKDSHCKEGLICGGNNFLVEHPILIDDSKLTAREVRYNRRLKNQDVCIEPPVCNVDDGSAADKDCEEAFSRDIKNVHYCKPTAGGVCAVFQFDECNDLGNCKDGEGSCREDNHCEEGLLCEEKAFLEDHPFWKEIVGKRLDYDLGDAGMCHATPQCVIKKQLKKEFMEMCSEIAEGNTPAFFAELDFHVVVAGTDDESLPQKSIVGKSKDEMKELFENHTFSWSQTMLNFISSSISGANFVRKLEKLFEPELSGFSIDVQDYFNKALKNLIVGLTNEGSEDVRDKLKNFDIRKEIDHYATHVGLENVADHLFNLGVDHNSIKQRMTIIWNQDLMDAGIARNEREEFGRKYRDLILEARNVESFRSLWSFKWENNNLILKTHEHAGVDQTHSVIKKEIVNAEWIKSALPPTIALAFYDGARFQSPDIVAAHPDYSLGCIRTAILDDTTECSPFAHVDRAMKLRHIFQNRMRKYGWVSKTDLVSHMFALAVDCSSKDIYESSLYDKMEWGRFDLSIRKCKEGEEDGGELAANGHVSNFVIHQTLDWVDDYEVETLQEKCKNGPIGFYPFEVRPTCSTDSDSAEDDGSEAASCDEDPTDVLQNHINDIWYYELVEKLKDNMQFNRLEIIALLGMKTHGHFRGPQDEPWVLQEGGIGSLFDNTIFKELAELLDSAVDVEDLRKLLSTDHADGEPRSFFNVWGTCESGPCERWLCGDVVIQDDSLFCDDDEICQCKKGLVLLASDLSIIYAQDDTRRNLDLVHRLLEAEGDSVFNLDRRRDLVRKFAEDPLDEPQILSELRNEIRRENKVPQFLDDVWSYTCGAKTEATEILDCLQMDSLEPVGLSKWFAECSTVPTAALSELARLLQTECPADGLEQPEGQFSCVCKLDDRTNNLSENCEGSHASCLAEYQREYQACRVAAQIEKIGEMRDNCKSQGCYIDFVNSDGGNCRQDQTLENLMKEKYNANYEQVGEVFAYITSGGQAWRRIFDHAYLKLSSIGCEDENDSSSCLKLYDPCKNTHTYTVISRDDASRPTLEQQDGGVHFVDPRILSQECNMRLDTVINDRNFRDPDSTDGEDFRGINCDNSRETEDGQAQLTYEEKRLIFPRKRFQHK